MRKFLKTAFTLGLSLFLLAACSLPGLGASTSEDEIVITGGMSTEMQILAYIVEGMSNHYIDVPTKVISNLGSSSLNHQALMKDDANVSAVRYTGTSVTGELGMEAITDPEKAAETVVKGFDSEFDQKWYPTYGFANTYAFMVSRDKAEELGLEKVSDLAQYAPDLKAGVDSSWLSREGDGYEDFKRIYGFDFGQTLPMSIGLTYSAVANDEVDVILGYSTDGRIISEDLKVLEDDKQLFPPYDASPVATYHILEVHPELDKVLHKLEGTINEETMQKLNYRADNYLLEPKVVADDWLKAHNYFEDKAPELKPIEDTVGGD
ncbi:osmoprotectant ABC transporter substrate-binding protein [Aerococcus sp. UMB7834]|uniref:osmoprotectant ABC transporter substrate-binding protein n=1 Tax=Aerococcus sp. UMB7834 TaxID=3046342 RepID=UPI00255176B0|nr:osmoprotectant ABC transporter substrate-binding protein [Aerococcus sp. UMB7834]MDK6804803.1 osmoprotectant ABC transporter substrate-binding protein [Aerococcus sp. UMB7834]